MKRKILLSILAAGTVLSAATMSISSVRADDSAYQPIIQRIAERFNLDEAEVEAVFEAVHDERFAQMHDAMDAKLSEAVKDGVITEDQKTAYLAKHDENAGERRANRREMQTWMEENGINATALHSYLSLGNGNDNAPNQMGRGMMR